jgi:glycosyltransferase involved in cell wall biosynthesis
MRVIHTVPIRDPAALAEKIDLLARDRALLRWISQNARERAREFSVEKYAERLVQCILTDYSVHTSQVYGKYGK